MSDSDLYLQKLCQLSLFWKLRQILLQGGFILFIFTLLFPFICIDWFILIDWLEVPINSAQIGFRVSVLGDIQNSTGYDLEVCDKLTLRMLWAGCWTHSDSFQFEFLYLLYFFFFNFIFIFQFYVES